MTMQCARVPLAAILGLRHRILRPGRPPESAEFAGDHDPTTLHFAATVGGEVVSCLSLFASAWQGDDAWQVRGMATDTARQRQGIGRRLLDHAVREATKIRPQWPVWCQARVSAIDFYGRAGWTVVSEVFEIEGIGPHVRMLRALPDRHTAHHSMPSARRRSSSRSVPPATQ